MARQSDLDRLWRRVRERARQRREADLGALQAFLADLTDEQLAYLGGAAGFGESAAVVEIDIGVLLTKFPVPDGFDEHRSPVERQLLWLERQAPEAITALDRQCRVTTNRLRRLGYRG